MVLWDVAGCIVKLNLNRRPRELPRPTNGHPAFVKRRAWLLTSIAPSGRVEHIAEFSENIHAAWCVESLLRKQMKQFYIAIRVFSFVSTIFGQRLYMPRNVTRAFANGTRS